MFQPVDDDTALEEVMTFLANPPQTGTNEDARFGEMLRQVLAASVPDEGPDGDEAAPRLKLSEDLKRELDDMAARRSASHPFGEHPDGIGPTLGMALGHH